MYGDLLLIGGELMRAEDQHTQDIFNNREIGMIVTKLEYLQDAVTTAQIEVTKSALERRDINHAIANLTKCLNETKEEIAALAKSVSEHVRNDVPIVDAVTTKVGKCVIALLGTIAGIFALEWINRTIKPMFEKLFNN